MQDTPHIPVLLTEVLDGLRVSAWPFGLFIDGTLGAGGHTKAILEAAPQAQVLGFDLDPRSLALARTHLAAYEKRLTTIHASYVEMDRLAPIYGFTAVQGILLDVGVSSMHFDEAERGFGFRQDGPLDMRYNPTESTFTAADIVNTWTESALADVIFHYGEDRDSRRIARAIVSGRPFNSTQQLANIIDKTHRGPREKIHPATRTFQALRIVVNDELNNLESALPAAIRLLAQGGRLAVISFHSLEDRIVKQYFRQESTDCLCPPQQVICQCGHTASVSLITRKPIMASDAELSTNPRARSAKLRIVEKKDKCE